MDIKRNKPLLRVLNGEALSPPPVWLMRQAGRYLPEYRALRAEAGSFLNLCMKPEWAAEITLQPIRRFHLDAAILFADILLIPMALGQDLEFVEGEGPNLTPAITSADRIAALTPYDAARLAPVMEALKLIKAQLPQACTLIGFAGAPWTVATYMVSEGPGSDVAGARRLAYAEPEAFAALLDKLADATIEYLDAQIQAGAEVVQVFESWAGALTETLFEPCCLMPTRKIVTALRERWPDVPVIGFPRAAGALYPAYAKATGVSALGVDQLMPMSWLRKALQDMDLNIALQGNLDPEALVVGGSALEDGVKRLLSSQEGQPLIVNLGHGIIPPTPPEHVKHFVDLIRGGDR